MKIGMKQPDMNVFNNRHYSRFTQPDLKFHQQNKSNISSKISNLKKSSFIFIKSVYCPGGNRHFNCSFSILSENQRETLFQFWFYSDLR